MNNQICIIAEKPSVAREIARIVGATERAEGYLKGNGYYVTWAFGHLVMPALPEGYGIKGFHRDNLPIIPPVFTLVPRQVKGEKGYKPDSGVVAQIKIIAKLFRESERIIVATDAGREGELIFRYLYEYIGCATPFDRLWISSENNLEKGCFINTHEIFKTNLIKEKDANDVDISRIDIKIRNNNIKRYVFIDDFCGSGTQAKDYSKDIVEQIKHINKDIEVNYLMLFGTEDGINSVKNETKFDKVETVFTIDNSFKCFSDNSRYFCKPINEIEKDFCKNMCEKYGNTLWNMHPLGYKDGQLLLSLFHNTPDNTLPIFWVENTNWTPIFKRFHKIY